MHNTYDALISGFIDDGLADMTGLAQEKIVFKKRGKSTVKYMKKKGDPAKELLWDRMLQKA